MLARFVPVLSIDIGTLRGSSVLVLTMRQRKKDTKIVEQRTSGNGRRSAFFLGRLGNFISSFLSDARYVAVLLDVVKCGDRFFYNFGCICWFCCCWVSTTFFYHSINGSQCNSMIFRFRLRNSELNNLSRSTVCLWIDTTRFASSSLLTHSLSSASTPTWLNWNPVAIVPRDSRFLYWIAVFTHESTTPSEIRDERRERKRARFVRRGVELKEKRNLWRQRGKRS